MWFTKIIDNPTHTAMLLLISQYLTQLNEQTLTRHDVYVFCAKLVSTAVVAKLRRQAVTRMVHLRSAASTPHAGTNTRHAATATAEPRVRRLFFTGW